MAMVEDPVCGMRIEGEEAAGTIEHEGKKRIAHHPAAGDPVTDRTPLTLVYSPCRPR